MIESMLLDSGIKKNHANILWTGGFDSTYRMVQLSKYPVTIQPYYLCDNRLSEEKELNAIFFISADIEKHPDTKCEILPLIKLKVADIKPDKAITEAFRRLNELTSIGSQFDWLARFATTIKGLELCIEKSSSSKAQNCIMNFGRVKKSAMGVVTYAEIVVENSDPDLIKIFGSFHFTLPLFELSKLEMNEEYRRLGFSETMSKTWFCHTPRNNEPCGTCNPCKSVIKDGLAFRIPEKGMRRYRNEMKFGKYSWFKLFVTNQFKKILRY